MGSTRYSFHAAISSLRLISRSSPRDAAAAEDGDFRGADDVGEKNGVEQRRDLRRFACASEIRKGFRVQLGDVVPLDARGDDHTDREHPRREDDSID